MRGKYLLVKTLSPQNESLKYLSKNWRKLRIDVLSVDFFSLFKAFCAKNARTITMIRNTKSVRVIFVIGPQTVSHWISGICGPLVAIVFFFNFLYFFDKRKCSKIHYDSKY